MDEIYCMNCFGEGMISICCDDLCQEFCIHGDGMVICVECDGDGYVYASDDFPPEFE